MSKMSEIFQFTENPQPFFLFMKAKEERKKDQGHEELNNIQSSDITVFYRMKVGGFINKLN